MSQSLKATIAGVWLHSESSDTVSLFFFLEECSGRILFSSNSVSGLWNGLTLVQSSHKVLPRCFTTTLWEPAKLFLSSRHWGLWSSHQTGVCVLLLLILILSFQIDKMSKHQQRTY
jgi:hypothetical protein